MSHSKPQVLWWSHCPPSDFLMHADPLLALRLEHFTPLVGSEVLMDLGAGWISARVIAAERIGGTAVREGGGFSVTLKAPVTGYPAQGTFPVVVPGFSEVGLFMSPRRLEDGHATYEFILN